MEEITIKLNENQDNYFTYINLLPLELQSKILQFYIFPYDVEHCVYPFKGDGNRRSMSINFDVNLVKKGFKKIQKENYYLTEI